MKTFTETVMPTHTNMHSDLAKLIAAGNRIDSASRALTGGEPITSHLPKWSGPRRDLCFLVGKRASLLAPHEACTAWQVLSLKIQAMEEMIFQNSATSSLPSAPPPLLPGNTPSKPLPTLRLSAPLRGLCVKFMISRMKSRKLTPKQSLELVLSDIRVERARQELLFRQGYHPFNCSNPEREDAEKFLVLGEEFGEVGKAAYERKHHPPAGSSEECHQKYWERRAHLRTELIQLAAVATAWAESLSVPSVSSCSNPS